MRTRMVAATVLMLALGSAGCARGGGKDPTVASANGGSATPSAGPSATPSDDPDRPLKFARCMRAQGLSWFPDPDEGKTRIVVPQGVDPKKVDAAHQKCKEFAPHGGAGPAPSAEDLEAVREMAKCMRENGVPNFPDPQPDGRLQVDLGEIGISPDSPAWKKAEAACEKYAPQGSKRTAVKGKST